MGILYIKAIHIIAVISWFAGLLYIVRLFIYHAESYEKPLEAGKVLRAQFKIMERRLWYGITWPAAIATTVLGYWLVYEMNYWTQPWMMIKIALTTVLLGYQIITQRLYKQFAADASSWTSNQLRMWNEVATLLMVAIVMVVVLKSSLDFLYGIIGFVLFGLILFLAIRIYKRLRSDS